MNHVFGKLADNYQGVISEGSSKKLNMNNVLGIIALNYQGVNP